MSRRWMVGRILAVTFVAFCGCGTALNLGSMQPPTAGSRHIYGGTRIDAHVVAEGFDKLPMQVPLVEGFTPAQSDQTFLRVCALLDLPVSFVADTLTLPISVPAAIYSSVKEEQKAASEPQRGDAPPTKTP